MAAADPVAYYTPHNDTHQIVYRSANGHLYELYWQGAAPVSGWDLTVPAGAPAATGNPAAYYSAGTNTKHVIYRSADGRLHEIWWVPGGGVPAHVDLTAFAGAPLAVDEPAAFTVEGLNTQHVAYRGPNGHIYEMLW
jgi:catechol 2,3-dioxygenase-like lactoylglutathione lyase family enzyme